MSTSTNLRQVREQVEHALLSANRAVVQLEIALQSLLLLESGNERCATVDRDGDRCVLRAGHEGPHELADNSARALVQPGDPLLPLCDCWNAAKTGRCSKRAGHLGPHEDQRGVQW